MPFTLTTFDEASGKSTRKTPRRIMEELETLGKLGQDKYRPDWIENMEEASGFLTDATRRHQAYVLGGELRDSFEGSDRFGTPCPADVLRPILARALGRNLQLFGGVQGLPETSEQEDIDQAEAAEKILDNKWRNEDLDTTCMEAMNIMFNCSHGYVLLEGDDTLMAPVVYTDPLGFGKRETRVGDVIYEALNPVQVLMPPGTKKIQDASALLTIQFMDVQTIRRRWPEIKLSSADAARYDNRFDVLVPGLEESMLKVRRLWIKGSAKKPAGEQYVFVGPGTHTVRDRKTNKKTMGTWRNEATNNQYPVIDFMDEPLRVGYYGRGRHTSARPSLKLLSSMWTKIAIITALPLMIGLPDGSGISLDDLADVPLIGVNLLPGSSEPKFIGVQGLEWYFRTMEEAKKMIMEVYSQHEPSRGKSPGSRFSAQGIEKLQQADRMGDSVAGKMTLKAMTRVMQRMLGEGLRVWPEEYDAIVLGRENSYQRHVLRKAELKPGIDVRVIPGKEEDRTKDALMKDLTEAMRWGMLDAPEARRIMGAQRREDMYNPMDHHLRKIKMEDKMIQEGKTVEIFPEDEHELHIKEQEKRNIERAFVAQPDELERRRAHIVLHIQAMQPQEPPAAPPGAATEEAAQAQWQEVETKQQEIAMQGQQRQQEIAAKGQQRKEEIAMQGQQRQQEIALKAQQRGPRPL